MGSIITHYGPPQLADDLRHQGAKNLRDPGLVEALYSCFL